MTAFTFSIEQMHSAPPEVRRWVAGEIARTLTALGVPRSPGGLSEQEPMALAACTRADAVRMFEAIGNDAVVSRLFFELARENALKTDLPGIMALPIADLAHHAGFAGRDGLVAALTAIDRAFHQAHGERAGSLFAFDDAGHLYLQEATQASIRQVWAALIEARMAAEREAPYQPEPRVEGFIPPHAGPSEDVAAHAMHPQPGGDRPF